MEPKKPFHITEQPGIKYYCACGRSAGLPYCDGAHKGTGFTPMAFTAGEAKEAYLCQCKVSKNPPYCDGAHKAL